MSRKGPFAAGDDISVAWNDRMMTEYRLRDHMGDTDGNCQSFHEAGGNNKYNFIQSPWEPKFGTETRTFSCGSTSFTVTTEHGLRALANPMSEGRRQTSMGT
jgi:hypothetical protein